MLRTFVHRQTHRQTDRERERGGEKWVNEADVLSYNVRYWRSYTTPNNPPILHIPNSYSFDEINAHWSGVLSFVAAATVSKHR